tara:strand:+ start:4205 stop:6109 length:1905 start_codon:yes stop_codon:yes gene_type:complete
MYNNFKLPIDFNNPKYLDKNIITNLQLKNNNFINNFTENYCTNKLIENDNTKNDNTKNDNTKNDNTKNDNMENDNIENDISNSLFDNKKDCIYDCIFKPCNIFSKLTSNIQSNSFTTNEKYLHDTQKLISDINDLSFINFDLDYSLKVIDIVNNIKNESNFVEKYQYLEIDFLKELNKNSSFLQILSIYNLFSPALNILTPIFLLLMPFIILLIQNKNLSLDNYIQQLTFIFKNNPIGKLINGYSDSSISEKCGLMFWGFLYIFQIYNSVNYCIKFFKNIKIIHNKINLIKEYLNSSLFNFKKLNKLLVSFKTYNEFNNQVNDIIIKVENFINNINKISKYEININKLFELGDLMKVFYDLHNDIEFNKVIENTYYLNGYIDNIKTLSNLKNNKKINNCKFINNSKISNKFNINGNYYPIIEDDNIIKNDVDLSNNIVITGPNASGKTTTIKSILFNILFSQQFGMGFYDSANIKIFDKFFCYLNIPDTNNRDSLFQAEARICKNIIEYIEENNNQNYLCIFDELYSGTNPEEAIYSSYSLLNYLAEEKCNFILTTHFYKLCKMLNKNNNIKNYHMKVIDKNDDLVFTYEISKGISKIKGASNILKKLNYPDKIIKNMIILNKTINKTNNKTNK